MKAKPSIQKHFALLTYFALVCGFVIAVTCARPAGVAQENHEHHHRNKIYRIGLNGPASGSLLYLLSHDYSIVDADTVTPSLELHPAVIGPGALANQDVTEYLVRAYNAGLTVAIVYATRDQANLFDELVEGEPSASCVPVPGVPRIAFYAVQKTVRRQPEQVSRYCLPTFSPAGPRSDDPDEQGAQSGLSEQQWLNAAFGPQAPPPPLLSGDDAGASSINLDNIAKQTHCSVLHSDANTVVQDDHFVTSGRSFDQQRDYYYVQDFPKYSSNRPPTALTAVSSELFLRRPGSPRNVPLNGMRILFSQPSTTTEYVSEYTNSRSTTVGVTVGFDSDGPNISAGKSVTVGTSTTVTVPPVTIFNRANLATGETRWEFFPRNPVARAVYDPAENWVWFVDRDVYGSTPNDVPEVLFGSHAQTANLYALDECAFPPPFQTFQILAPVITSADPANVQRGGGTFTIRGLRMYPGIVSDVLLGGDALPTSNFVRENDTEIKVVVPSSQRTGLTPIQVNTSVNGTVLPSNNNVRVNVK